MEEINKLMLSDAIESYIKAEIKIAKLKIAIIMLSILCIAETIMIIMR